MTICSKHYRSLNEPPWHMNPGIIRWNGEFLKWRFTPPALPFSPVHNARKFSAVFGVTSEKSSKVIRPTSFSPTFMSKNTYTLSQPATHCSHRSCLLTLGIPAAALKALELEAKALAADFVEMPNNACILLAVLGPKFTPNGARDACAQIGRPRLDREGRDSKLSATFASRLCLSARFHCLSWRQKHLYLF